MRSVGAGLVPAEVGFRRMQDLPLNTLPEGLALARREQLDYARLSPDNCRDEVTKGDIACMSIN